MRCLTVNSFGTGFTLSPEIHCIRLVGHNLLQVDDVLVPKLPQNLDLPHSGNGKPLLLIFKANLLESKLLLSFSLHGIPQHSLEDLSVGTLANLVDNLEKLDGALAPVREAVLRHLSVGDRLPDHFRLALPLLRLAVHAVLVARRYGPRGHRHVEQGLATWLDRRGG